MTILRVIDIETSHADVIEIGSVDVAVLAGENPAGPVTCHFMKDSACVTFVKPPHPVAPDMSAIHHIIDADLDGAPSYAAAIVRFTGAECYVAHNARFEAEHLPELGPWLCTLKAAYHLWPGAPGFSLQTLRYWLGLPAPRDTAHRALPDAIVGAYLLQRQLTKTSLAQLLAWSVAPAIMPRATFGKHKGERFSDVPTDYLEWLATKATEANPDAVATARYWLAKRAGKPEEDALAAAETPYTPARDSKGHPQPGLGAPDGHSRQGHLPGMQPRNQGPR